MSALYGVYNTILMSITKIALHGVLKNVLLSYEMLTLRCEQFGAYRLKSMKIFLKIDGDFMIYKYNIIIAIDKNTP